MKVLITGAGGMLGADVWRVFEPFYERVALGRRKPTSIPLTHWRDCDIHDADATYQVITKENPDLVVHCAAFNNVDRAEAFPDEAFQVNAVGTRNVALACQRFDATLMAVSSDYVFDGSNAPDAGYREFDPPRPINTYGQSKRWGELHVEQLLNKFFIVRTAWLFGEGRRSYADAVADWALAGQPVPCVSDMVSTPTYTADLAQGLLQLAQSRRYGLYHLTNGGACSRVEFAEEILRIHKKGRELLKPMTQAEFKHPARRPAFSALENLAWRLEGFQLLRPWQQALRDHFAGVRMATQ